MPTKTSTILGPKWTWKNIKRMKIANMRVIIDFIKHKKKKIKAYGERLDPWPQRRPLEILEILAKIGLKKKAFYNQI